MLKELRIIKPRYTNVPLESGDALVLRQTEVHRTDATSLAPDQWRLAIGFKVLRKEPVVRASSPEWPFGKEAAMLRREWPGLLPDFKLGGQMPVVYNHTAISLLVLHRANFFVRVSSSMLDWVWVIILVVALLVACGMR
eukprot:2588712-Pleurochrysis_carterae.AAC.1